MSAACRILLLSDGRPGHYHLAEGVIAAIKRRREVSVSVRTIKRRRATPTRVLIAMLQRGVAPWLILKLGYGVDAVGLPAADLVVSAGGETIAANAACAQHLLAVNIYCGTLKHLPPTKMSLVISSYKSHEGLPNHAITLKPNGMDPDELGTDPGATSKGDPFGLDRAPELAGLLIGGNSGLFSYEPDEWEQLLAFMVAIHGEHGTRWIVSTSRRSDDAVGDAVAALAAAKDSPIAEFIDFRSSGPGTLPGLFKRSQVILCTEDSSTMISEAVCARRPVVGVAPLAHGFKPDEREYREFMLANDWCRFMPLGQLTPAKFLAALAQITPLRANHLDRLGDVLEQRLPSLFRAGRPLAEYEGFHPSNSPQGD